MADPMRRDWKAFSVATDADLRQALLAVDRGKLGVALVVDGDNHLLGTVTDGDLRRAILRGAEIETPVEKIMNRNFTAVNESVAAASVMESMHSHSVKQIPVLDGKGRVTGIYFLGDFLGLSIRPNCALIMAGGEGRRMLPLTRETPKPMLPVGDGPVLENTVSLLVSHGFRNLFIAIRYLGEQIESHFGDGSRFGCQITYIREQEPMGTAGALSLLPVRPDHSFLVVNGDLLTDLNLSMLMDFHAEENCAATQCVREYVFRIPFGVVRCEEGQVMGIEEKPMRRVLISAGIYVLSPKMLDAIPSKKAMTMPELLEKTRQQGHRVMAFPIRERWEDIGQPEDYHWAVNHWDCEEGK